MDTGTTQFLCELNTEFYKNVSDSFSATRQSPWTGWHTCWNVIEKYLRNRTEDGPFALADIACGNLRFESFMSESLQILQNARGIKPEVIIYAVDNCMPLVPENRHGVQVISHDVIKSLLDSSNHEHFGTQLDNFDVVTSFGFMHHIPSQDLRVKFLHSLLDMTKPGGYIMISFWQFMNNESLARKTLDLQSQALKDLSERGLKRVCLEEGDYFLGWKDTNHIYRYCHHFSQTDIEFLVASVAEEATLCNKFECDGRSENLNSYIVLQKREA